MCAPLLRLAPLVLAGLAACGGPSNDGRPNVLLISIDSLRRDLAAPYGWQHPLGAEATPTPSFERLAAEGALFEDAVSTTSWTLPSHMALLTGQPDALHGVTDNFKRLHPEHTTLAERLHAAGWATAGFFSGPNLHPAFGFAQGFDLYKNCAQGKVPLELFTEQELGVFREVHLESHETISSPRLLQESSDWIQYVVEETDQPFFAFVHCWDPHYDYRAPEAYTQRFERAPYRGSFRGVYQLEKSRQATPADRAHMLALYEAEALWTDEHLSRLLDHLDALGVLDDTIVVVTSDHGEEFWEHGRWGHQRTLYDEVLRVPLLMRYPSAFPAGTRVPGQARLQDIAPTLLELAGLESDARLEGQSLLPLLEADHPGHAQHLLLSVPAREIDLKGWRLGTQKVLWDEVQQQGFLYDLASDPLEHAPRTFDARALANAAEGPLHELRAALEDLAQRARELPPAWEASELPSELIGDLEAAGYLGDGD